VEENNDSIIKDIRSFAAESLQNRMPTADKERIFDEPLVQFADGDDEIFTEYKSIIAPEHMTPREALAKAYDKNPDELPRKLSVISWVLPITGKTRESNRSEKQMPSRPWSHTRWFGEIFNDAMREHVVDYLIQRGHMATAPMKTPHFKMIRTDKGLSSNWSERHMAYAAGLGTFSLSDGFITERGIAHRCASVVTDMELSASPRTAKGPYANCLFHADGSCGNCITRCPVGAITEQGHDKAKCGQYLRDIGYEPQKLAGGYDLETSVAGCGLCQTGVPCEAENPTRNSKR
jgi:epoxyqueuosine reductase QueG